MCFFEPKDLKNKSSHIFSFEITSALFIMLFVGLFVSLFFLPLFCLMLAYLVCSVVCLRLSFLFASFFLLCVCALFGLMVYIVYRVSRVLGQNSVMC